ncbi:hypothetical protein [Amycolatopsis orientalis]|uniref:hypothetical protein n=1 Tax=Amycolatopsis orientalis TaxID=31958 RepID=UPI0003AAB142|nr:hypothetical protein [Amycolatopsis orientalis]
MTERRRADSRRRYLERKPVEGSCPHCRSEDLAHYPVNTEGGWYLTVKCQQCLHSIHREPWSRLGPVHLLSDTL